MILASCIAFVFLVFVYYFYQLFLFHRYRTIAAHQLLSAWKKLFQNGQIIAKRLHNAIDPSLAPKIKESTDEALKLLNSITPTVRISSANCKKIIFFENHITLLIKKIEENLDTEAAPLQKKMRFTTLFSTWKDLCFQKDFFYHSYLESSYFYAKYTAKQPMKVLQWMVPRHFLA